MSCNDEMGTHFTGCQCWEARRDAELAQAVNERDAARALAGQLRAAVFQGVWPTTSKGFSLDVCNALAAVPETWEPRHE